MNMFGSALPVVIYYLFMVIMIVVPVICVIYLLKINRRLNQVGVMLGDLITRSQLTNKE